MGFFPAQITGSGLSNLVSFAFGGLLGDIFLHLLPETFTQSGTDVLGHGLGLFMGFMMFFMVDKSLRIVLHNPGEKPLNNHNHSHTHEISPDTSAKTLAYLNLISDFAHNITDGLALSSAFYTSQAASYRSTLALLLHELPHQIGDFGLLIQSGFSKRQAIASQFITSSGAYLGVFLGIVIQQGCVLSFTSPKLTSILGYNFSFNDLTMPFTTGGFIYIAFSILPELLEIPPHAANKKATIRFLSDLCFICIGFFSLFYMEMNE
ncbi:hypothetical protein FOA43_004133 [Brettanomyces nanus]|uniref:Uncharacterized protein n=1 Tax=Eeniella nana TaxID=13502 RepID=A0A875SB05_EENNA|nr:uncharacterized protein FOA43_004133 [Brettanomyces nanus]QPG76739.1 hypothetical protein FOA43_004133 [Brettanomyces nanus]